MNENIETFIASRKIAVVGVSEKKFGGTIYRTLKRLGYEVSAVHPTRASFDGDQCADSLKSLTNGVRVAVVAVNPDAAELLVEDARQAGITHLWFQQGKDFSRAQAKAEAAGLKAIAGKCILMYAQPVTGVHAFHRFLAKLFGKL